MQGWKATKDALVSLIIPDKAKIVRVNGSNKLRCDHAYVQLIRPLTHDASYKETTSIFDPNFHYILGNWVKVDNFTEDPDTEAGFGIHFFETMDEAEDWWMDISTILGGVDAG